jgi:hypothetical protein
VVENASDVLQIFNTTLMSLEADRSDDTEDPDLRILGLLEDQELKTLAWGLVDGGFADDELLDLLEDAANAVGDDRSEDEIKQQLESRVLITKVASPAGDVWRTRMAETVRLLARLRQLFPEHMNNGSWRTAPTLVSDFRFVARQRLFPDRKVSAEQFVDEALGDDHGPVRAALEAMTAGQRGWAPFQVRATKTILQHIGSPEPTATLVAAGTGSGKTKAVYLPALAHLSSFPAGEAWTKMLALYPRNELLKDQLQAAIKELRLLKKSTGVALTIGAFFGDTPFFADKEPGSRDRSWKEKNGQRVCPFLRCPSCDADLYWFNDDGVGGLTCSTCTDSVRSNELLLSRVQQQNTPPDVLLTTVETLNRQLGNDYALELFGAGRQPGQRPRLLLLDEVHTYSGLTGAQVAHLLRRWRYAVGEPVHSVGLSATITDGAAFFGDLTSTHPGNVDVVEPMGTELLPEGKEYLIALRGNPAAGTALLSLTIQASMLMRRCLDHATSPVSGGAFGSKLFAFTDKLDVTNRFAHFLRNAEGQSDRGKPDPRKSGGSLANLRHVQFADYQARIDDGQAWDLCRRLNHTLDPNQVVLIERTSSQDAGFNKAADIVVATSSLEVGLDDDSVGAVLQHKAPRDSASFVQRRGRAGRTREMRPWTAVVLSDYGQDRMAFQAWDDLFDPQLRPLRLPTLNRYVLRIQATHALLDWLADQLRKSRTVRGNVWGDLTGPKPDGSLVGGEVRRRRLLEVLVELLDSSDMRADLSQFLSNALLLEEDEVDQLLWAPPRGVLSVVVPTLIRRLESEWNRGSTGVGDYDIHGTQLRPPLPDFLPAASFSDLLLPEVEIAFPDASTDPETIGVESALTEFSPGKVTHRFAIGWAGERLWVPAASPQSRIEDTFDVDPLETVVPDGEVSPVRVLRPWRLRPVNPEIAVKSSSNAKPIWRSSFQRFGQPIERATPNYMDLDHLVSKLEFFLHKAGNHLTVYRFSIGSTGTITRGQEQERFETHFVDENGPVGLGYRLDTDGVCFEAKDPDGWDKAAKSDPTLERALRKDWFKHCVVSNPDLKGVASIFVREWLAELSLAAIVEEAVNADSNLPRGIENFKTLPTAEVLDRVLQVIFQSVDPTEVTGAEAADEEVDVTKLHREIVSIARDPVVVRVIHMATDELVNPTTQDFETWIRDRYLATVAGALAHALALLHEEVSVDDLVVDTGPWVEGSAAIRVSERKPGGVGLIEAVHDAYTEDPLRFWRLLAGVVDISESEVVDQVLTRFVTLASSDTEIRDQLEVLRGAQRHQERVERWRGLTDALEEENLSVTPSVKVALSTRFLRPGASNATDVLLDGLLSKWSSLEAALGLEIDPRIFAHLISGDQRLDQSLGVVLPVDADARTWRFNAFISLLWPRGSWLRTRPVELWRSFQDDSPAPDRSLLAQRLKVPDEVVLSEDNAEVGDLASILEHSGVARVRGAPGTKALRDSVLKSLVAPVEVGVLQLFPRVVGLRRSQSGMSLELEVPEIMG